MAEKRTKGWASVYPSRCRATHYAHPTDPTVSLCGRSPIRVTEEDVRESGNKVKARAYRAKEICDHCQHLARRRRKPLT